MVSNDSRNSRSEVMFGLIITHLAFCFDVLFIYLNNEYVTIKKAVCNTVCINGMVLAN
jgi:hypothetical protein